MNVKTEHEKKERMSNWISPKVIKQCDAGVILTGCKSRSEFVERAISFYSGYISAEIHTDFFAPAISAMMEGTVASSENRMARLLFKIAVEMAKLQQMLASISEMEDETLRQLHISCVNEVKKINGFLKFEDAVKGSRGD